MKCRRGTLVMLALSLFFVFPRAACPDDSDYLEEEDLEEYKSARVTKTVEGLNFNVEADRPIEKVDGVLRPVAIDTYVAIKFKKLEQQLDRRLAALEERLKALEAAVEGLAQRAEEEAAASGPAHTPQEAPEAPGPAL